MSSDRTPTHRRPRLLVVGAGAFQLELLRAAKALAEVIAVDGSARAPGLALADHARVVDLRDLDAVVAVARELAVDGVMTAASDVAVPAVSAVVRALGLVGLAPATAERCRDKLQAFECVHAAGLPVPETRALTSVREAEASIAELGGYPVVIKPRSGGGGRGVSVVHGQAELADAFERARASYLGPATRDVLIQQFIDGHSVGVEAFFAGAKLRELFVLDDQFEPGFVSPAGHSLPTQLGAEAQREVAASIAAFGVALGLDSGAVNFDLRRVGERTLLIEVNPRLGGNSITDLIGHAYGVELARAAVLAALGRDPSAALERRTLQPVAARLILRRGRGIAHFGQLASEHPDLLALDLNVSDGQRSNVHVDDFCLLGRCIVRGRSAGEAVQLAEHIAHSVADSIELEAEAGA